MSLTYKKLKYQNKLSVTKNIDEYIIDKAISEGSKYDAASL